MYTATNYKTKKDMKEALALLGYLTLQTPFIGTIPTNGTVFIEGPHNDHKWYAEGTTDEYGRLVKVK